MQVSAVDVLRDLFSSKRKDLVDVIELIGINVPCIVLASFQSFDRAVNLHRKIGE